MGKFGLKQASLLALALGMTACGKAAVHSDGASQSAASTVCVPVPDKGQYFVFEGGKFVPTVSPTTEIVERVVVREAELGWVHATAHTADLPQTQAFRLVHKKVFRAQAVGAAAHECPPPWVHEPHRHHAKRRQNYWTVRSIALNSAAPAELLSEGVCVWRESPGVRSFGASACPAARAVIWAGKSRGTIDRAMQRRQDRSGWRTP